MNNYITPRDVKQALPDGIQAGNISYDAILYRAIQRISRAADRHCRRVFYPSVATRYFNGNGSPELWVDDLISVTSLYYSTDNGLTYTALAEAGNFHCTYGGDFNSKRSSTLLVLDPNGDLSLWPEEFRSVKITGVWGAVEDVDVCWIDSGDEVENNPLAAAGTELTINALSGKDEMGISPRFDVGMILQIESEILISTGAAEKNLSVKRAWNGSTAAAHAQNTQISIFTPPADVTAAVLIQVVRMWERGQQGFADARADSQIGELIFTGAWDPEAKAYLSNWRRLSVG